MRVIEPVDALPRTLWDGPAWSLYLRPASLLEGDPAHDRIAGTTALPLAGDDCRAFERVEAIARGPEGLFSTILSVEPLRDGRSRLGRRSGPTLDRLTAPRPLPAGLRRWPAVMGIVNVTPDSFSDGGAHRHPAAAVAHGRALAAAGADILDIGGESTRPGAAPVPVAEELDRVLPVIEGLAPLGVPISIDTRKPAVMAAAVGAGASLINDVTALRHDPESLSTAAALGVPVVLMHMGGTPETMQDDPRYDHPLLDVYDHLASRLEAAEAAGIPRTRLLVDPGIGFGKTDAHNLAILGRLELFHGLGVPIVLGVSRKSLIGRLSRGEPASARLGGSLALALDALRRGVQVLRVHDVAETVQAIRLAEAVRSGAASLSPPDAL